MAEEDFKFQLSLKLPGRDPRGYSDDMLNIRADSYEDFLAALNGFLDTPQEDIVAAIAQVTVSVKSAAIAAQGLAPVTASSGKADEAQQTTQGAPADPVPGALQEAFKDLPRTCNHGAREFREGKSAKGPWAALFCPLPKERKSEQCSAEFANLR